MLVDGVPYHDVMDKSAELWATSPKSRSRQGSWHEAPKQDAVVKHLQMIRADVHRFMRGGLNNEELKARIAAQDLTGQFEQHLTDILDAWVLRYAPPRGVGYNQGLHECAALLLSLLGSRPVSYTHLTLPTKA